MGGLKFARPDERFIDSSKTKKINYQGRSFLNGLNKVKKEIKELLENKQPNYEKLSDSFD